MKTIAPQLPTVLGSFSAMLVAFLGLTNGTSPGTCLIKAMAAFLVFAGFGLILRFALSDVLAADAEAPGAGANVSLGGPSGGLDVIVPGTSVAELLAAQGETARGGEEAEAA